MCTVSFIPVKDTVIITSNRDENIQRGKASAPSVELRNNKKIIFPKDPKAGGTWFAAADDGIVAVLLNGAFIKHIAKPPYRKSRGLVLLEIIESADAISYFRAMDLDHIEPFTIILYQQGILYELRWDDNNKHELLLNSSENHIWSSATLYSEEARQHRKNLFGHFIDPQKEITADSIYAFHSNNHQDDENGFIIDRQTGIKTFSITQAIIQKDKIDFLHSDLLQHQKFKETIHSHALTNS